MPDIVVTHGKRNVRVGDICEVQSTFWSLNPFHNAIDFIKGKRMEWGGLGGSRVDRDGHRTSIVAGGPARRSSLSGVNVPCSSRVRHGADEGAAQGYEEKGPHGEHDDYAASWCLTDRVGL